MPEDTVRALARLQLGIGSREDEERVAAAADGAPLRRAMTRRSDRLAIVSMVLALIAVTVAVVVGATTLNNSRRIDRTATAGEKAICAVVVYAEHQAEVIRPRNHDAAIGLEMLAAGMRKTGISCPPRP